MNLLRRSLRLLPLIALVFAVLFIPSVAFAQEVAPAAPAAPWYFSSDLIAVVIAAVTSLLAIWQSKEKRTAQKVSESLVVAIESASKLPEVSAYERKIKQRIQSVAEDYAVEPVLNALVKKLT